LKKSKYDDNPPSLGPLVVKKLNGNDTVQLSMGLITEESQY